MGCGRCFFTDLDFVHLEWTNIPRCVWTTVRDGLHKQETGAGAMLHVRAGGVQMCSKDRQVLFVVIWRDVKP